MRKEHNTKSVTRKRRVLINEEGSVMIVALAMLMLLTLIGISATTTSMIEIQIAGAKKTHTDHLFLAEGAAMQCVQVMENDPNLLTNTTYRNDIDTITDADIILVVGDAAMPDAVSEQLLAAVLKKNKQPAVLALNKIDLVEKERLLHRIDGWAQIHPFEAIVPVSAKLGIQVEALLQAMECVLPYGPPYFSEQEITDMPERFIAAEMIREKVFRLNKKTAN